MRAVGLGMFSSGTGCGTARVALSGRMLSFGVNSYAGSSLKMHTRCGTVMISSPSHEILT